MPRLLFNYNDEMLTIIKIAEKEGLNDVSLRNQYKITKNIYEAVRICKENQKKRRGNIEYNGELLSVNAIAEKEELSRNALLRQYKETKDIYKAVRICKENQKKRRGNIEYNGEKLSLSAIAEKERIVDEVLGKQYKKTKDIYEAVRICKENQKKYKGKIEYYGEKLTLKAIAEKEGLTITPLSIQYKKIKNIYEAVKICKKNQERFRGNIEYNGQILTLKAIAKKEGLSESALTRKYKETKDIYKSIKICKENKSNIVGKLEYNGELLTINIIAQREGIEEISLRNQYKKTKNVYEAVKICKENKEKRRGSIEYNGERLTLKAITTKEGLNATTLRKYYKKTKNIYKAVFICKNRQINRKRKKEEIDTKKYGRVSYYDLSLILGIKFNELMNLIDKGYKVDEIIEMDLKQTRSREGFTRKVTKLSNGQTLREYCVENKLNYACIYRAINIYGKNLEEAVDYYKKNGQQIPKKWIFEKYGLLLRHIMLRDRIDIDRVVKYMRDEVLSLEEGVEKYIIRKNAKKDGLDEEWMEEIYDVLTDDNIRTDYDQYKSTFYVDDKEEENIIQSCDEVETFKRKLVLFEIAEAIEDKAFTEEEEIEVLREYNITEQEIEIIFMELYKGFKEPGVLLGEYETRKEMTKEEQERIQEKIDEYKRKVRAIRLGQDEDIIATMKQAVGKNVGKNGQTREALNYQITRENNQKR